MALAWLDSFNAVKASAIRFSYCMCAGLRKDGPSFVGTAYERARAGVNRCRVEGTACLRRTRLRDAVAAIDCFHLVESGREIFGHLLATMKLPLTCLASDPDNKYLAVSFDTHIQLIDQSFASLQI